MTTWPEVVMDDLNLGDYIRVVEIDGVVKEGVFRKLAWLIGYWMVCIEREMPEFCGDSIGATMVGIDYIATCDIVRIEREQLL